MGNANIGHRNQNIMKQVILLMRNHLIKKATERKVVKKEGGGTTQKLLRNHSRKLKNEFGMQQ